MNFFLKKHIPTKEKLNLKLANHIIIDYNHNMFKTLMIVANYIDE